MRSGVVNGGPGIYGRLRMGARKEGRRLFAAFPPLFSVINGRRRRRHATCVQEEMLSKTGAFFFGATAAPAQETQPDIWPKRQTVAWRTFLLMSHVLIGYRPSSFLPSFRSCCLHACFISVQPSLRYVVVSICAVPLCVWPDCRLIRC